MDSSEKETIFVFKGVATVLVVLGHAMTPEIRATNILYQTIWDVIYSFHMFAFFTVSGWLFEKSISKYVVDRRRFIKTKFKRLIIPYITLTCLEYVLIWSAYSFTAGEKLFSSIGISNYSLVDFIRALVLDINHFDIHIWFVYVLFFIFIINILFPKFTVNRKYFMLLMVFGFMYSVLSYLNIRINAILYWAIPFCLGRIAHKNRWGEKIKALNGERLVGILIAFAIANVMYMQLNRIQVGGDFVIGAHVRVGTACLLRHLAGFFGTLLLAKVCFKIKSLKYMNFMKEIGSKSYGIYLFHQPFLTTGVATIGMKIGFPSVIVILMATIMGVVIPILFCDNVIKRNKILTILFPI